MENIARKVRVYTKRDGDAPFTRWLDTLKDERGRYVIRARLERVQLGSFGDCRSVGEGVMELRIDSGLATGFTLASMEDRLLFYFVGDPSEPKPGIS